MKEIKALLGDTLLYGIGGIFIRATQILLLPLILFYLEKSEFGILDFFLSIKNILVIVYGWGVLTAIFKFSDEAAKKDHSAFNGIIIILSISVISFLIIGLLSWTVEFVDKYWSNFVYVHIISTFNGLLTIPLAVFRQKRLPVRYVALNLLNTVILLGASYYLIINSKYNYVSILIAHSAASIISFSVGLFAIRRETAFQFNSKLIVRMANFGFSILLNSLSFVILLASTRFFLKSVGSFEDVGILGMAQRISLFVGALLISPFALAWLPFVKAKSKEKIFKYLTNRIFSIFLWVGLLLTFSLELLQKDIFYVIGNTEYLPALKYVIYFSFSYLLQGMYFIFSSGIFLSGNTKQYKIIGLTTILFNIILYLICYSYLSIQVVSVITLGSFLFNSVLAYLFGNKNIRIRIVNQKNIGIIIFYSSLFIALFNIDPNYANLSFEILFSIKVTFLTILFLTHIFLEKFAAKYKRD